MSVGFLLSALLAAPAALPPSSPVADEETIPEASSDEARLLVDEKGVRFLGANDDIEIRLRGRIGIETAFLSGHDGLASTEVDGDPIGNLEDATEIRRTRLVLSGRFYDDLEFETGWEFSDDPGPSLKNNYIRFLDVPAVQNVKVGYFREPMGLEQNTSAKYVTFMERSLTGELAPGRALGVMIHGNELGERLAWFAGAFREVDDEIGAISVGDGELCGTARVTGAPWYEEDGAKVLHLGASFSVRGSNGGVVSYAARPEAHLAPKLVSTGDVLADGATLTGLEAMTILGPVSIQAEGLTSKVDPETGSDLDFSAWFVTASWFLTGEHRAYRPHQGRCGPIRVDRPAIGPGSGSGAWEVAARYSSIDLDDGAVAGGELEDLTLGVNWYLTRNVRLMGNYVRAELDSGAALDALMFRIQVAY